MGNSQNAEKNGSLYIVAAPSGAGKTTLVRKLCEQLPNLEVSVSHTTRPRRTNESDGVDYFFIDEDSFMEKVKQERFLEHATVFNHHYGTSKKWVQEKLDQNIDIILEIDWQGAQDIRKLMPGTISIFILPPSFEALAQRLYHRGDDDEGTIKGRMECALNELSHYKEFDYIVINDDINTALDELKTIIESIRENKPVRLSDNKAFAEQIMAQGAEVK